MKLVKTLHLVLMLSLAPMLFAQGIQVRDSVTTSATNVQAGSQAPVYTVPYARIKVCSTSFCTTSIPLYQDAALTQVLAQPVTADAQGKFSFYVAAGSYFEQVTNPGGSVLGTYPISPGAGTATASAVAVAQTSAYTALSTATTASANAIAAQTAAQNAQTMAGTASSNATAAQAAATNAVAAVAAACPKSGCTLTGPIVAANDTPTGSQLASANYVTNAVALVATNAQTAMTNAAAAQTAAGTATTNAAAAQAAANNAAAVAAAAVQPSKNLSDIANPATALSNLGGATAASVTAAQTAATNAQSAASTASTNASAAQTAASNAAAAAAAAVQPANNLSDIANPATALSNLGGAPVASVTAAQSAATNAMTTAGTASTTATAAQTTANSAAMLAGQAQQAKSAAAYSATTTYAWGVPVVDGLGNRYVSLQNANKGNTPSPSADTAYWALTAGVPGAGGAAVSPANTVLGDLIGSGGAGQPVQKLSIAQQRAYDQALLIVKEVTDRPKVDATSTDAQWYTAAACANGADSTYTNDSTCALQAAINYASTTGSTDAANRGYPVFLPPGRYKVAGTLYIPLGVSLISDATTGAVLQNPGNANDLIVYGLTGKAGQTSGPGGGDVYVDYASFSNITLAGSDHASTGTLLSMDTGYIVANNLHFYNTGGRGIAGNYGERMVWINPRFYNVRWPIDLGGDINETAFYSMHGVTNGATHTGYLYDDFAVNGAYPAAGTTAAPTTLRIGTHAGVWNEKSSNVQFLNGDEKGGTWIAGFCNVGGANMVIDALYTEADNSSVNKGALLHPSVYAGGCVPPKTTITGPQSTLTVGGNTEYTMPVADASWMPIYYQSQADLVASASNSQYSPFVIIPSDFSHSVAAQTTASATCPGLMQGSYETISNTEFFANNVVLTGRNGGKLPSGTTNYDWGSCTAPPIIEDYNAANSAGSSTFIRAPHFRNIQGATPQQNGYTYTFQQGTGPTTNEIVVGVTPGYGTDFFTQAGAVGDPAAAVGNYLTLSLSPDSMVGGNTYQAIIGAVHPASIAITGAASPGLGKPFADTNALVPAADGSERVSTDGAGAEAVVAYPEVAPTAGSNNTVVPVNLSVPGLGLSWDTQNATFSRTVSFYNPGSQTSTFWSGMSFANDWQLSDVPLLSGNGAKPNFRMRCFGSPVNTTPGCEWDGFDGSNFTQWLSVTGAGIKAGVPIIANGGFQGGYSNISTSTTLTAANRYVTLTCSAACVQTLPTPVQGQDFYIQNAGMSGTVSIAVAGGLNIYGASGSSYTSLVMNGQGALHIVGESGHYRVYDGTASLGTAAIAVGAGAGAGATATTTATSNNNSGSFSVVVAATGTASSVLATITETAGQLNTPNACQLIPQSALAATAVADLYTTITSSTVFAVNVGATGLAPGTYQYGYICK